MRSFGTPPKVVIFLPPNIIWDSYTVGTFHSDDVYLVHIIFTCVSMGTMTVNGSMHRILVAWERYLGMTIFLLWVMMILVTLSFVVYTVLHMISMDSMAPVGKLCSCCVDMGMVGMSRSHMCANVPTHLFSMVTIM